MLLGSGAMLLLGLAFGSEAYRGKGIPLHELAVIGGPFIVAAALLVSTVLLWNTGKYRATYALFAMSLILLFAVTFLFGIGIAI